MRPSVARSSSTAELVGIHVSPPPFLMVGFGEGAAYVGPEVFEAQREANRLVRERVEAAFRRLCDPAKMSVRDIYEEGDPGTSWPRRRTVPI